MSDTEWSKKEKAQILAIELEIRKAMDKHLYGMSVRLTGMVTAVGTVVRITSKHDPGIVVPTIKSLRRLCDSLERYLVNFS